MPRADTPFVAMPYRTLVSTAVALIALAVAPVVFADDEPPPIQDVSAIDQYRESVPTSQGPRAVGEKAKKPKATPKLSKRVREQIRKTGGEDAALLERLATSPDYGATAAPPKPKPAVKRPKLSTKPKAEAAASEPRSRRVLAEPDSGTAVGAGVAALSDEEGGNRGLVLILLIGAIAAGGVGIAGWRVLRVNRTP